MEYYALVRKRIKKYIYILPLSELEDKSLSKKIKEKTVYIMLTVILQFCNYFWLVLEKQKSKAKLKGNGVTY